MKLTKLSKSQLETLAVEEFGLALDGLDTKAKLIAAMATDEIDDDLFANYFPPVQVITQGTPENKTELAGLTVEEQLNQLDSLAAKIKTEYEEGRKLLAVEQAKTSPFIGEPIDAPVLITEYADAGEVDAEIKRTGRKTKMQMVQISGIAFPGTRDIPCNIRTNVEWLRDYKFKKGDTINAKIGIYKESERKKQAETQVARRAAAGQTISPATALATIPHARLIIGSSVESVFDIIENSAIRKSFTGHYPSQATAVESVKEQSVAQGAALRRLTSNFGV